MRPIKDIKTKRPWRRVTPDGYGSAGFDSGTSISNPDEMLRYELKTQADFLREYFTEGHKINSPKFYPDIFRADIIPVLDSDGNPTGETTRKVYREPVPRYSFAFQQIITAKQLVHLCGNDIQFEVNKEKPTKDDESNIEMFREGWLQKDMEIAFYDVAKSVKTTGDGAVVFFVSKGILGRKSLSYLNGDRLYPHYASDGSLELFARSYYDYDDEGTEITEWMEIWDKKNYYLMKRDLTNDGTIVDKILNFFNVSGYVQVQSHPHGFNRVPVAYMRDEMGPCWSASQSSIEAYEMSFSQMAHNNAAFGEPILMFVGDDIDINFNEQGTIKYLSMPSESKAEYLQAQSASESYQKQLDVLHDSIYKQSFIVDPPELKSGDLPAAALKILYSPAVERAINDASIYQPFLNDVVELFEYGYGLEKEDTIGMTNLPMKWWIKPYVHVSESAIIADLVAGVNAGFISKKTASERASFYTTTGEFYRVNSENNQEQAADLLYQIKLKKSTQTESTEENTENKDKENENNKTE